MQISLGPDRFSCVPISQKAAGSGGGVGVLQRGRLVRHEGPLADVAREGADPKRPAQNRKFGSLWLVPRLQLWSLGCVNLRAWLKIPMKSPKPMKVDYYYNGF